MMFKSFLFALVALMLHRRGVNFLGKLPAVPKSNLAGQVVSQVCGNKDVIPIDQLRQKLAGQPTKLGSFMTPFAIVWAALITSMNASGLYGMTVARQAYNFERVPRLPYVYEAGVISIVEIIFHAIYEYSSESKHAMLHHFITVVGYSLSLKFSSDRNLNFTMLSMIWQLPVPLYTLPIFLKHQGRGTSLSFLLSMRFKYWFYILIRTPSQLYTIFNYSKELYIYFNPKDYKDKHPEKAYDQIQPGLCLFGIIGSLGMIQDDVGELKRFSRTIDGIIRVRAHDAMKAMN